MAGGAEPVVDALAGHRAEERQGGGGRSEAEKASVDAGGAGGHRPNNADFRGVGPASDHKFPLRVKPAPPAPRTACASSSTSPPAASTAARSARTSRAGCTVAPSGK